MTAQRPRASSSGSRRAPSGDYHCLNLLNARGRLRRVHGRGDDHGRRRGDLLNARGRLRRVHYKGILVSASVAILLNARGRLRRVHFIDQVLTLGADPCSTPEGVFVGFTLGARRIARNYRVLLNARGRLRRVHLDHRLDPWGLYACSTPEGVFVGFTPLDDAAGLVEEAAQRPRASSSGSRRLHRPVPGQLALLNARGRLRRVHQLAKLWRDELEVCSTPEGVFVGFTGAGPRRTPAA